MAENTAISWADDTFNPWIGCTKVSPACDGCYAEALMDLRHHRVAWGAPGAGEGTRVRTVPSTWAKPVKWEKEQAAALYAFEMALARGETADVHRPPARFVFCASLADVMDTAVEIQWFWDLVWLMRATPHLTWLLLTKRPQNILKRFDERCGAWPRNAALGTTVEDRKRLANIEHLMVAAYELERRGGTRPAFLFGSFEPLLEDLGDLHPYLGHAGLTWVITGGETDQGKHRARPSHPDWFRSIRDQCAAAGVPYHHKQNGEWTGYSYSVRPDVKVLEVDRTKGPTPVFRIGKKASGRYLDGVIHDARPELIHG